MRRRDCADSLEVEVFTIVYPGRIQSHAGKRERKDLRVISRMQLVNGHEGDSGAGKESRAMVLDPIILPLSRFCFAAPGRSKSEI